MINAVEFDFTNKAERTIPVDAVCASCESGKFCWIDIDAAADAAGAEAILKSLGINSRAIEEALGPDVDGRHDLYDECLHTAMTAVSFAGGHFKASHVDMIVGEKYLVTLRRGTVEFVEQVRAHYRQDFLKFAQTPSFLLYEYWDHLTDNHKKAVREVEQRVEKLQERIFADADDTIFNDVAELTRNLLEFRKIMSAAREVLYELSTRRSPFVSEATQPYLEKMVGTLERLGADLAVSRETVAEAVNLYMGVTSHRTNRIVNRLTVVSMIFLPLTFLCGVYGMNFNIEQADPGGVTRNRLMPELTWEYGYISFWIVAIITSASLLAFMKWRKWW